MFDLIRRSRSTVEAERLKADAVDVGGALAEAAAQAGRVAAALAEQAKEAAAQAVDWAGPRLEKAWHSTTDAAAPKVERAAERAVPLVDTAHDRLVDELIPKVVAAVTAAAAAAAAGADRARDATSAKLTEIAHIDVPEPKRSHAGATVLWIFAGAAAAGAAYAAYRSSRPTNDPWAEQPWEPVESQGSDRFKARAHEAREELGGVVTDVRYDLGEAAESVGEVAGGAVARTREASEKAKEAGEKVAERAREATEKAREAAKKAAPRRRASSTAGGTISDVTGEGDLSSDADLLGTGTTDAGLGSAEESTPVEPFAGDDVPVLPWPDDADEQNRPGV